MKPRPLAARDGSEWTVLRLPLSLACNTHICYGCNRTIARMIAHHDLVYHGYNAHVYSLFWYYPSVWKLNCMALCFRNLPYFRFENVNNVNKLLACVE